MFDSHTYPKGSVVLHTLRRKLGDKRFFAGLNHYLTKNANQPVVSNDLCEAMTDATGVNCEPFWNQWIYKPGHPVIDASWVTGHHRVPVLAGTRARVAFDLDRDRRCLRCSARSRSRAGSG